MGSKTTVAAPPPSPFEDQLMQEQTALLRQQRDLLQQAFARQEQFVPTLEALTRQQLAQQQQLGPALGELTNLQLSQQRQLMEQQGRLFGPMEEAQRAQLDLTRQLMEQQARQAGPQEAFQQAQLGLARQQLEQQARLAGPQEEAQRLQLDLTRQLLGGQREAATLESLLRPTLLQQQGLREVRDASGQVVGFEEIPEFAARRQQQQTLETALAERSLQALRGELPVSPALERQLGEQEQQLRESLRRQLGPGFETSTPGIESLARQRQSATELREGARRGELTLAEQLGQARTGLGTQGRAQDLQSLLGLMGTPFQRNIQVPGMAATQVPGQPFLQAGGLPAPQFQGLSMLQFPGLTNINPLAFGQAAAGFQGPLAQLAGNRGMQLQASLANAQMQAQRPSVLGSLGSLAGFVGGSFLGPFGAAGGAALGKSVFGG